MSFLQRAKSMHERGDAVRAAFILAEGLKREPDHGEALEWLLHLYVEELPNPGIERELLHILMAQRNGHELYDIVEAELEELGRHEKLDALHRTAQREGISFDAPPPEPPPVARAPLAPEHVEQAELPIPDVGGPARERWDEFDSPLAHAPDSVRVPRADQDEPPSAPRPAALADRDDGWDDTPIDASTRQRMERRRRAMVLALLGLLVVGVIAVMTLGRGEVEPAAANGSADNAGAWTSPGEGSGP